MRGLTFAVKDLFDVAGYATGNGNPTWLQTHGGVSPTSAPAVQVLLDHGATFVGKTQMDELAYSLNGENYHYGTPDNPAAPGRIPGGSSSGSAVVVARGDVAFALGSDTAGSVRIPSSYCGLWGFRPTHGRVSMIGSRPLAQSFDTAGWFAKDATTLRKVGQVLLTQPDPHYYRKPSSSSSSSSLSSAHWRWRFGVDAFALADPPTAQALRDKSKDLASFHANGDGDREEEEEVVIASCPGMGTLEDWLDVFRVVQGYEVWANHGGWIQETKPTFGPGVKERFEMASRITPDQAAAAREKQGVIAKHLREHIFQQGKEMTRGSSSVILVIPTSPGPAPLQGLPGPALEIFRRRALSLTCIAGLAGLPQVNIPLARVHGDRDKDGERMLPVGLSLIGPPGSDEELLQLAQDLAPRVRESF